TAMPSSGGTYVYIERAFGPIFGTISGIGLWLAMLLKSAFALVGLGAYMLVVINMDQELTKYVALIFLAIIFVLNITGVKKVGKFQLYAVGISVLSLIMISFFGLQYMDPEFLTPFKTKGNIGLLSTVAFVYLSYSGVTKVAAIAEEIKNPSRNLPLAMILSLVLITIIYVVVSFVLVGNIPVETLGNDLKPIYTLSLKMGGPIIGVLMAIIGIITLISTANAGVLASSRFPFAMARDKLLPEFMSKIDKKYLTPVTTITITCITMLLVILFLDVIKIAKLASAFKVMMFVSVNMAVIVLRETSAQWYRPKYKSPLYPYVQIFGILSGLFFLAFLGMMPILAIFGIFILGAIIYSVYGKEVMRTGVLRNYGHRPALYLFNKKEDEKVEQPLEEIKTTTNIDPKIASDAGAIVPLLGNENSPEALVDIAAAINSKKKIQALKITEIPNQTYLDAVLEDSSASMSLKRRLTGLSKSKGVTVDFESVVTHELSNTINELSSQSSCEWLVMGWDGRSHSGILVSNPIGWLLANINSNLALFKDKGVRHVGKVLLALRPGRKDRNFIETAQRVCTFYGASLTLLHVVPEKTTSKTIFAMEEKSSSKLEQSTVKAEVSIVKSDDPVGTISGMSAGYDLLILGTPEKDNWINVLFGGGKDKFTEKSACSVLRLTVKD
ncbi:MAG: amino acid permease, partial [Bacteroidetes bacterium]|nr:amino acid permease [Bacteroidota bacterium]